MRLNSGAEFSSVGSNQDLVIASNPFTRSPRSPFLPVPLFNPSFLGPYRAISPAAVSSPLFLQGPDGKTAYPDLESSITAGSAIYLCFIYEPLPAQPEEVMNHLFSTERNNSIVQKCNLMDLRRRRSPTSSIWVPSVRLTPAVPLCLFRAPVSGPSGPSPGPYLCGYVSCVVAPRYNAMLPWQHAGIDAIAAALAGSTRTSGKSPKRGDGEPHS